MSNMSISRLFAHCRHKKKSHESGSSSLLSRALKWKARRSVIRTNRSRRYLSLACQFPCQRLFHEWLPWQQTQAGSQVPPQYSDDSHRGKHTMYMNLNANDQLIFREDTDSFGAVYDLPMYNSVKYIKRGTFSKLPIDLSRVHTWSERARQGYHIDFICNKASLC